MLPGPLAASAVGVVGLLCVIVAGWTTANPTIYRAGLAFQAIVPKASRFKVTLATGILCAVIGIFPAIAMKLLSFVALYGLVLMPMGAVIFCDFWFMKRFGMQPFYADAAGKSINWAPALAWIATVAICVIAVVEGYIGLYFASLPGWFIASILYLSLSKMLQRPLPAVIGARA